MLGFDVDAPVRELSGDQRRRVELVRSLAAAEDMVLLDEQLASLDGTVHETACAFVLHELHGFSLVVAIHDEADAALIDTLVYRLG